MRIRSLLTAASIALIATPTLALAHGGVDAGPTTELVVGWATEPAFAGFPNAVEVIAEHDGALRNDADLAVTVLFGGEDSDTASDELALEKAFGQAGTYHAPIIPTDAGRYTFHITGTVGEDDVDIMVTSGDDTFDDVSAPTDLQFPTTIPAGAELAASIEQLTAQGDEINAAVLAAQDANDSAANSRIIAVLALGVGALSALFGFSALRRSTS